MFFFFFKCIFVSFSSILELIHKIRTDWWVSITSLIYKYISHLFSTFLYRIPSSLKFHFKFIYFPWKLTKFIRKKMIQTFIFVLRTKRTTSSLLKEAYLDKSFDILTQNYSDSVVYFMILGFFSIAKKKCLIFI